MSTAINRNGFLVLLALLALSSLRADEISLVRVGEGWRYFPGVMEASSPVTAWRQVDFDDSAWAQAPSGFTLSYDETTVLPHTAAFRAVFFRKRFVVSDPQTVKWLVLRADYQAGFVAYLNSIEVARRGLAEGPAPFDALAADHPCGVAEDIDVSAFASALLPGTNLLAIQLHVGSNSPNAMVLVPELLANFPRGPLVQNTTTNSVQVIWRTPVPADSTVEYGLTDSLGQSVYNPALTTSHVLTVTGLSPGTAYFYRARSAGNGAQAVSPVFCFRTLKLVGDITFAVFGDGESGGVPQFEVARAVANSGVDLVLYAGDVMYPTFTLGRADTRCLSIYGPHMRTTPYFFTMGNHDLYSGDAPYLETFFLPTNSVNGTEYFYSFDHGDAHFASLYVPTPARFAPSLTNGLWVGSVQYSWLTNDLAASAKPWKILFLHSPLHTSGPHRFDDWDYDGVKDRLQLQQILLPVAQQYGVQAIFSGHDHDYERFTPVSGVHLFVTGGGGCGLYHLTERDEASAQFWSIFHFLRIAIHGDTMSLEAVDTTGAVFDAVSIQRAVPPPQVWSSTWRTPVIETGQANDGDGNITGQTFDLAGTPIPALSGEFSDLGQVFVNNDGANLYIGLKACAINSDANIFLFIESPRLAGVTNLAGLGNGIVDPADQGADGLDFLENLSFTNFTPGLACILGDEFADGQFRSWQRPALALNTGQGVFRLDSTFSDVPGARLQQFNTSPQRFHPAHESAGLEQNADFIEVAIPLAALGSPNLGQCIKIGAVVGGPGIDTNFTAQTRQLDAGFLGVALHGAGQGPVALEGLSALLALAPTPGDSDGDGLPDGWEVAHGLNPLCALGDDGANGDPDQDGFLNWQEYLAGTDPRNPTSPLRLAIAPLAPGLLRLSWHAVIGKQYQLEVAENQLTNFVVFTGGGFPIVATNASASYVDDVSRNPSLRARFYRVRVVP